jgi:hypothetical protein
MTSLKKIFASLGILSAFLAAPAVAYAATCCDEGCACCADGCDEGSCPCCQNE